MSRAEPHAPLLYPSYRHLLAALLEGALTAIGAVCREVRVPEDTRRLPTMVAARHFLILSAIIRRTTAVSRYLKPLPLQPEERQGRVMEALDRVFTIYADNRIDVDVYQAALDIEIEIAIDPEVDDLVDAPDPLRRAHDDADIPGRPPAALVAELCRDLGMVIHTLPTEWLQPIPSELRLLCARAAAAAIRPAAKPARIGHLMER